MRKNLRFKKLILGKKSLLALFAVAVLALLPLNIAFGQGKSSNSTERTFLPYVFGVYTLVWLAFFGYAFFINRRQRELRREIDELRKQQAEKQPS